MFFLAHNVFDKRAPQISERRTLQRTRLSSLQYSIRQQQIMSSTSYEAKVVLAIEAIQSNRKISIREAAKVYNVADRTICCRLASKLTRRDTQANSRCLTDLEGQTIVQYITKLAIRIFLPTLRSIEDIANYLQRKCDAPFIGKR